MSESEGVKRLLILLLLEFGTPSREIGMGLDSHPVIARRMFASKAVRKPRVVQ